jgi:Tfp pilus assembly protein PilN
MPNSQASGLSAQPVVLAGVPKVNLMPPEIAEAAKFRRFQLAMGGAFVAALAIVGALYVHEHSAVKSAQTDLEAAQAQQTSLQSQRATLQSVQDVYTRVASKQAMLQQAMGSEIRWSYYLTDLSLKVPDHVWLTNLQATQSATGLGGATTAAPASPVSAASIGTIDFQGVGYSHDDVATWLDTLAKERGFVDPYFTNSTEATIGSQNVVNFDSSVGLTDAAESGRYTKPAGS